MSSELGSQLPTQKVVGTRSQLFAFRLHIYVDVDVDNKRYSVLAFRRLYASGSEEDWMFSSGSQNSLPLRKY